MGILTGRRTASVLEQGFQVFGILVAIGWLGVIGYLLTVGAMEIAGVLAVITLFVVVVFVRNELAG